MTRRRTRRRGRIYAALTLGAATAWAWQTHPAALILTALTACAIALGVWRARAAWLMREGQRTVLYRHYFSDGTPLYYGISNDYAERCGQHADKSWWWFYVDPARSTAQMFPNRHAAALAETAAIRRDGPIGNTRDNPAWSRQRAARAALQAQAWASRGYACPPPVPNTPTRPVYVPRRRLPAPPGRPFADRWAVR